MNTAPKNTRSRFESRRLILDSCRVSVRGTRQLSDHAARASQLLGGLHRRGGMIEVKGYTRRWTEIVTHTAECTSFVQHFDAQGATARLRLVDAVTGNETPMEVRLYHRGRLDKYAIVEVRARPTELAIGSGAFAAALGRTRARERRELLAAPLLVLRRLLRALGPGFEWSEETEERIADGDVELREVGVAMYRPLGSRRRLTEFFARLSAPIRALVSAGWTADQLKAYLGLTLEAGDTCKAVGYHPPPPRTSNATLGVRLSDPSWQSPGAGLALPIDPAAAFLKPRVRIDVAMDEHALAHLAEEAELGRPGTAADFSQLASDMHRRSKHSLWPRLPEALLGEVCPLIRELPWNTLLRALKVAGAKAAVSRHARVAAVWGDWSGAAGAAAPRGLGGLLRERGVPEREVRLALDAVRGAGLDPDVPPPSARQLAATARLGGVARDEAEALFRAVAEGDESAAFRLATCCKQGLHDHGDALSVIIDPLVGQAARVPALPPTTLLSA